MTRRRLETFGHDFVLLQASALALPFPDASFDLVYSWGVLMHTGITQRGIDEAWRVLRPGGTVILMLYNRNSLLNRVYVEMLGRKFDHDAPIVDVYSNSQMRELLAGFRIAQMQNFHFLRPNVSRLGRYLPRRLASTLGRRFGYCTYLRGLKRPG